MAEEEHGPWEDFATAKESGPWDDFAPSHQEIPQPFIDRVRAGEAVKNILSKAASGFEGSTPTGLSDESLQQGIDLGLFHDPAKGRGSPLQMLTEGATFSTAGAWQSVMGAVNAGIRGGSAALGEIVDRLGGRGEAAEKEAVNFGNWAMVESGFGRFSRPSVVGDHPVGTLPRAEDFAHGDPVVERNLRDRWQDDGVHPSEALHDAKSDAFVKQELETPPYHPPDRSGIATPTNSLMEPGTPRTEIAKTGDPLLDAMLEHPTLRKVVNDPVIDDTHTIPNSWGGSVPIENPTVFIDKDFPRSLTVDGVTFDPAGAAAVHENVEQLAMNILTKNGMDRATALKVAFWEFGEKAEDAFHAAHGMDPVRVEEVMAPIVDAIAARKAGDVPSDLFKGTYPDGNPAKAGPGPIDKPTAAEIKQAREIIGDHQEAQSVFHGSAIPFTELSDKGPYFFTPDAEAASNYAQMTPEQNLASMRGETVDTSGNQPHVMPAALKIEKPFRASLNNLKDAGHARDADWLRKNGYDGAILRDPKDPSATEFVALDKSQVTPRFAAGADVTRPENLPSLEQQPPPRRGSLSAAVKDAGQKLFDIGNDIQMKTTPMAAGSSAARATAKDFANNLRRNRWEWSRYDDDLRKRFDPEQRKRMWDAADEESVARQLGESTENQGLVTLEPAERAVVEDLQARAQAAWLQAKDLDMVASEGLPAYTPRMVLNVASATEHLPPKSLNELGRNVFTRTAQMRHRKYMMAEETEKAAKELVGKRMAERGASQQEIEAALEDVKIARDIRALPLATAKLEDAIAGRTLINKVEEYGKSTGTQTVSYGAKPSKEWFTIDHPAFKRWEPSFEINLVTGKIEAKLDDAGIPIFKQVPLYVHGDFEGPLRAVLSEPSGAAYGALMSLKGKTMGLIMNSPLIHNLVEWGRSLPAMPGKVATGRIYFQGNLLKKDPVQMREAIDAGLVPIGHRFFNQDINAIMEEPNLSPGRSWTAQVLGAVPGLFDEAAGDAVKAAIDKAGNFWHNTLLWDRVADLQAGLYGNFRDAMMAKGMDRLTAARVAAHWANRYAGALPQEAMSNGARKLSNLMLFSRSFTMGNIGAMKDMLTGLPRDVMAQIERDGGLLDPKAVRSVAWKKAASVVLLDMGLMYIGNSLLQSGINVIRGDSTVPEEMKGYADRLSTELQTLKEHPLKILQPLAAIESLSSTTANEPGREERLRVGYAADGTAIYARNPVGKIGEEFSGYLNGPLDMIKKKLGTLARPAWQIMANDAGFGRKIVDPNGGLFDSSAKYYGNLGAIAMHIIGSQLPEGQIGAITDLVKGDGDPKVNTLQAFGPIAGVTFSKGAPGGPAVGELYNARTQHQFGVDAAMPDIRKQIQRGDIAGAQDRMTQLGVPPGLQRFYIRTSMDPATRLGGRTLRDFYQYSTPEQRERLLNAPRAPTP